MFYKFVNSLVILIAIGLVSANQIQIGGTIPGAGQPLPGPANGVQAQPNPQLGLPVANPVPNPQLGLPVVNSVPNPQLGLPVANPVPYQQFGLPVANPVPYQQFGLPVANPVPNQQTSLPVASAAPVVHPGGQGGAAPNSTGYFGSINFEKAKDDIIRNIKRQYSILQDLTHEFKEVFRNETAQAQGAYKQLTDNIYYYFTDPHDHETTELDNSLVAFYPFGGKDTDYVDTIDKMNDFCSKLDSRLDALRSWIRRKYRYNMVVQVSFNLILGKIHDKNSYFCNATAHKEDYVKNMIKVKESAAKLVPYKEKLMDTAAFIQNSTIQLPKIGRLCCSFWEFYKALKNEVKTSQAVDFAVDITYDYFTGATKYACFLYPYGSELCKEEEKAPKMPHQHQSLILESLITMAEIATP